MNVGNSVFDKLGFHTEPDIFSLSDAGQGDIGLPMCEHVLLQSFYRAI